MAHEVELDETLVGSEDEGHEKALSLLIGADGKFTRHSVPEQGSVTFGRQRGNTFVVDHPSVSRRHAVLHIGRVIEIEDLGSVNGLRVQGRSIPRGRRETVLPGQVIQLGDVIVILRRAAVTAQRRARRIWPHSYFEARVEEQCARADASGEAFAVLRLNVENAQPGAGLPDGVEQAFVSSLRATDMLALYAPDEYEILLVDTKLGDAEAMSHRLLSQLEDRGFRARVGMAVHPRDGSAPEAIIARACDAVRGIAPARAAEVPPANVSPAMRDLRRLTKQVAASDLSVLILGETGVGKEVLAETVHRLSPRSKGPFVKLHCAALSETLLESELFGHEKGAFTGAHQAKPGLLESAHGGSVLLDEVGELPLSVQVKLLRVLEDRKVQRVGALTPRWIDVRFIAATNRDLEAEVATGRFRLDLYFRLNGVSLVVPALRARREEIESLARTFVRQAAERMGLRAEPALSPEGLEQLMAYDWPGNVRELRNTLERAVLLCGPGPITSEHLPTEKMGARGRPRRTNRPQAPSSERRALPRSEDAADPFRALVLQRDALERERILDALEQCAGNQTRAARQLGISRGTLLARLDAFGIARPRKRTDD